MKELFFEVIKSLRKITIAILTDIYLNVKNRLVRK